MKQYVSLRIYNDGIGEARIYDREMINEKKIEIKNNETNTYKETWHVFESHQEADDFIGTTLNK